MKKTGLYILLTGCMFFLCACSVKKEDKEKLRDVEFTVVDSHDVPEELQKKIDDKKESDDQEIEKRLIALAKADHK